MRVALRRMRLKRLLTQAELAKASGVTQQNISKIESIPGYDPGVLTLARLARVLRCTVDDLLVDDNDESA